MRGAVGSRWDRRDFLRVGGGLAVAGVGFPDLARAAAPRPRGGARSCILVYLLGGPPQLDTWDLKPSAPAEVRGAFRPIPTAVPGTHVCEHLPRLARLADRYCLVRSMTHGNGGHDGGMHVAMTGHSSPAADTPYYGAVAARLRPATRNVPSYVWVQNLAGDVQPRYLTGGFLGAAYSPVRIGTDLDNPSAPGFRVKVFDPPADVPPE